MRADLHLHTTASDGVLAPCEVVEAAFERGVDLIAVCDHDSVDGVAEAREAARLLGILLIPGIEFSARFDEHDVHVLGYGIDPEHERLLGLLSHLRAARRGRIERMVDLMVADGIPVSMDDIRRHGSGTVGRAHVARALVDVGAAHDVRDAFVRLIGEGHPYYLPKTVLAVSEVVEAIRSAGGVAVVAHPWRSNVADHIPALVSQGVEGVEAFHSEQTADEAQELVDLAQATGLLVTGGSDWHGDGPGEATVGCVDYPVEHARRFLEALGLTWGAC